MMHASSLMPGMFALHAMICARSSEFRHEKALQARSDKCLCCIISDPRVTRVAFRQASVSLQKEKTDPLATGRVCLLVPRGMSDGKHNVV